MIAPPAAEPTARVCASRPVFTRVEADLIGFLEVLLEEPASRRRLPEGPFPFTAVRREVAEAGAERMARAALRFLVRAGGFHARAVLRGGRRVMGRLWDAPLNEGFRLHFTDASRRFWLASARTLPTLLRAPGGYDTSSRQQRRIIRDMIPNGAGTGDWILHALALRRFESLVPEPEMREAINRKLCLASPLAALLAFDHASSDAEMEERLAPLTHLPGLRLLECVDDALTASLEEAVPADLLARPPDAGTVARLAAVERVLRVHVALLDRARRLDLSAAVLRFLAGLFQRVDLEELRRTPPGSVPLAGARLRAEVHLGVAHLLELGHGLLVRRDDLAEQRYGDERYEEAQLFVRAADETLGPQRSRMAEAILVTSGFVGGVGPVTRGG